MNIALYQLADQYLQILEKTDELGNEDSFSALLDSLESDIEEKATNVAMYIRNLETSAESIKQAESEMAARRKALESKSTRIKQYLLENMNRTGITKIECPYFAISVRDNPESLVVDIGAQIPDEYYKQPPPPEKVLDKVLLKKDIKEGLIVEGCRLERKQRVDIK
jgi:hypothetical protein